MKRENQALSGLFSPEGIFRGAGLFFFFLMLVFPTIYQAERGALLLLLCLAAFTGATSGIWRIDRQILFWLLVTTSASLLFMVNGVINDAPGALRVGTVYVVWPILYVFLAGFFQHPEMVVKFEKVIILGIIVSAAMGILLVFEALAGQDWGIKSRFGLQGAAVGIYRGYIEYRLKNMTTLIYGLPFLMTLLLLESRTPKLFRSRVTWIALVLILTTAAISGRRAFWLSFLLSPFIIGGLFIIAGQHRSFGKIMKLVVPIAILSLAVSLAPMLDIGSIGKNFISAFDSSGESSAGIRYEQFGILAAEWLEKPVLGHGAGAAAEGMNRNETMTWAYELSYMALLLQTGILGLAVYGLAVLWIFVSGISIVRQEPRAAPVVLPLLAALAGFLIVNATNPYLGKFDYLWTLFLPVAAINAYRSEMHGSISSSSTGIPATNSSIA